ncbi:hypothetical protein AB0M79_29345 [Polymorphospora sp. NPDC051019]|uniref:hypothetical protein n=1 Tax=Polymorphospora sp. NPDC051019 TaxID=3155725 RepID=UPI00343E95A3
MLIAPAARTTVVAGRPGVDPPNGYTVISTGPYRPPIVRQVGYSSAAAGEGQALGSGWIHAGVASSGGFEDQLFAVRSVSAGTVHGRPAMLSGIREGAGMIVWEPTPGAIAFVGYGGGNPLDDSAVEALRRLAGRARPVTSVGWQALRPVTIEQVNDHRRPGPWPTKIQRVPGG